MVLPASTSFFLFISAVGLYQNPGLGDPELVTTTTHFIWPVIVAANRCRHETGRHDSLLLVSRKTASQEIGLRGLSNAALNQVLSRVLMYDPVNDVLPETFHIAMSEVHILYVVFC